MRILIILLLLISIISSCQDFRSDNTSYKNNSDQLFRKYGWTIDTLINKIDTILPKDLIFSDGEIQDEIFWAIGNQFSKSIGLDYSDYLSKQITVETFRLNEELPIKLKPYKKAYGVILLNQGNIIGGFIANGHFKPYCSLDTLTFFEITGKSRNDWIYDKGVKTRVLIYDRIEVIENYYNYILNKDYNSANTCLSLNYLYDRFDSYIGNKKRRINSYENIDSVKLINIQKMPDDYGIDEPMFKVDLLLYQKEEIVNNNGLNMRFIKLIKEPMDEWKIKSIGTGP
jgi:hypothetical protein